jgi:aminoglycoside phosphotransferase (APT) family kinase protein
VIGLLDWELSTIGHPLSDLANLLQPFYIPSSSDGMFSGFRGSKEALPIPSAEELMQVYCQEAGIPYPIQNWSFCVAFAFFRVAVITQGIAARVARKQASSAQAKVYAQRFIPFTNLALEIVDQGELDHVAGDKSKL